jgi:hypothetical protein
MKLDKFTTTQIELAKKVMRLQDRQEHPEGSFDSAKRWYPDVETDSLGYIRSPSRAWPYTYMNHCRTAKYQAQRIGEDPKAISKAIRILRKSDDEEI